MKTAKENNGVGGGGKSADRSASEVIIDFDPSSGVNRTPSGRWMLCVSYQGQTRYMGLFDTEDQAKSANIIVRGKFRTTRELRLTKNEIKKEVETVKRDAREAVGMRTSRGKVKGKPKKIKSETLENRASRDAGRTSSDERVLDAVKSKGKRKIESDGTGKLEINSGGTSWGRGRGASSVESALSAGHHRGKSKKRYMGVFEAQDRALSSAESTRESKVTKREVELILNLSKRAVVRARSKGKEAHEPIAGTSKCLATEAPAPETTAAEESEHLAANAPTVHTMEDCEKIPSGVYLLKGGKWKVEFSWCGRKLFLGALTREQAVLANRVAREWLEPVMSRHVKKKLGKNKIESNIKSATEAALRALSQSECGARFDGRLSKISWARRGAEGSSPAERAGGATSRAPGIPREGDTGGSAGEDGIKTPTFHSSRPTTKGCIAGAVDTRDRALSADTESKLTAGEIGLCAKLAKEAALEAVDEGEGTPRSILLEDEAPQSLADGEMKSPIESRATGPTALLNHDEDSDDEIGAWIYQTSRATKSRAAASTSNRDRGEERGPTPCDACRGSVVPDQIRTISKRSLSKLKSLRNSDSDEAPRKAPTHSKDCSKKSSVQSRTAGVDATTAATDDAKYLIDTPSSVTLAATIAANSIARVESTATKESKSTRKEKERKTDDATRPIEDRWKSTVKCGTAAMSINDLALGTSHGHDFSSNAPLAATGKGSSSAGTASGGGEPTKTPHKGGDKEEDVADDTANLSAPKEIYPRTSRDASPTPSKKRGTVGCITGGFGTKDQADVIARGDLPLTKTSAAGHSGATDDESCRISEGEPTTQPKPIAKETGTPQPTVSKAPESLKDCDEKSPAKPRPAGVYSLPSGKWKIEITHHGKRLWISSLTRRQAVLANQVAREKLESATYSKPSPDEIELNIKLAKEAALRAVSGSNNIVPEAYASGDVQGKGSDPRTLCATQVVSKTVAKHVGSARACIDDSRAAASIENALFNRNTEAPEPPSAKCLRQDIIELEGEAKCHGMKLLPGCFQPKRGFQLWLEDRKKTWKNQQLSKCAPNSSLETKTFLPTKEDEKKMYPRIVGLTLRPSGKWEVQVRYQGGTHYIGIYDTKEQAVLANKVAREKLEATHVLKMAAGKIEGSIKQAKEAVGVALSELKGDARPKISVEKASLNHENIKKMRGHTDGQGPKLLQGNLQPQLAKAASLKALSELDDAADEDTFGALFDDKTTSHTTSDEKSPAKDTQGSIDGLHSGMSQKGDASKDAPLEEAAEGSEKKSRSGNISLRKSKRLLRLRFDRKRPTKIAKENDDRKKGRSDCSDRKERQLCTTAGVSQSGSGKWRVEIGYQGTRLYMGGFKTRDQAISANTIARDKLRATRDSKLTASEIKLNIELARESALQAVNDNNRTQETTATKSTCLAGKTPASLNDCETKSTIERRTNIMHAMTRINSTRVDAASVALSDGKASSHTPIAEIVEGASPAWNSSSNHVRPKKTIKETGNKGKSVANHSSPTEIDPTTSSGVSQTSSGKWVVSIQYQGKKRYMGSFDTQDQAMSANSIARGKLTATTQSKLTEKETKSNVQLAMEAVQVALKPSDGRNWATETTATKSICLATRAPASLKHGQKKSSMDYRATADGTSKESPANDKKASTGGSNSGTSSSDGARFDAPTISAETTSASNSLEPKKSLRKRKATQSIFNSDFICNGRPKKKIKEKGMADPAASKPIDIMTEGVRQHSGFIPNNRPVKDAEEDGDTEKGRADVLTPKGTDLRTVGVRQLKSGKWRVDVLYQGTRACMGTTYNAQDQAMLANLVAREKLSKSSNFKLTSDEIQLNLKLAKEAALEALYKNPTGVRQLKSGKWVVEISFQETRGCMGTFDTIDQAILVNVVAQNKLEAAGNLKLTKDAISLNLKLAKEAALEALSKNKYTENAELTATKCKHTAVKTSESKIGAKECGANYSTPKKVDCRNPASLYKEKSGKWLK